MVSEQVARAKEALLREMKNWGVSSGAGATPESFISGMLGEVFPAGPPPVKKAPAKKAPAKKAPAKKAPAKKAPAKKAPAKKAPAKKAPEQPQGE
ncbi:unannotated protein [freshwater metagenome]|uniref:Unannotated protein n=1 Tax=freshwater metagenome TaxID=449393 RepID=A0A6J6UAV8_9ZZZZ